MHHLLLFGVIIIIISVLIIFYYRLYSKNEPNNVRESLTDENSKGRIGSKLPILDQDQIRKLNENVVCIGYRDDPTKIRCVKVKGTIFFPEYGKQPKCLFNSDSITTNGIKIPFDRVINTTGQCWAETDDGQVVSENYFLGLLVGISLIK